MGEMILEIENITKHFPGVVALNNVTVAFETGKIHALVGENGAGKSTLMKILSGAYQPDAGKISFKGQRVHIHNPRQAQELGISIIMQEFNLLPYLTVEENIYLGWEPTDRTRVLIDDHEINRRTQALLASLGVKIDPKTFVENLTVAQCQFVEIAKALSRGAEVLIMDEPSSTLTDHELEYLFKIIASLKSQGVTIIYISHRLTEVFAIADRVTVLKDGQVMGTRQTDQVTRGELITLMVGRALSETFPPRSTRVGETILKVDGLTRKGAFEDIHLEVHSGEIVGIAGLVGAGRTELARAIFGSDPYEKGTVEFMGKSVRLRGPHEAVDKGIVLVPEDRKLEGLVQIHSIRRNISLPNLALFSRNGVIHSRKERDTVLSSIRQLDIRASSPEQTAMNLSGGNQQKAVIAKWLVRRPKLIIMDEPTRGIDVASKAEIYRIMRELTDSGVSILMISSELPEILGMADRILVMHEGRISTEFRGCDASEEEIMQAATGG
jgi:ribose transport system ATP-binding protein